MTVLLSKSSRKQGSVELRLRIRDGRAINFYYHTGLYVDAEQLAKFDTYGCVSAAFGTYDHDLRDTIEEQMRLATTAYSIMRRENRVLNAQSMQIVIHELQHPESMNADGELVSTFVANIETRLADDEITESTATHLRMYQRQLARYLVHVGRPHALVSQFSAGDVAAFSQFLRDEYLYTDSLRPYYFKERMPTHARGQNTIATTMKKLKAFFSSMHQTGVISKNPFECMSKSKKTKICREQYDSPVFLRADEFRKLLDTEVPESLLACKDCFVVQCALGCRISDFQGLSRSQISVDDGVPFFRYCPRKTSREYHDDVETPILFFALKILKRYDYSFPILNNASGKSGYNVKIKELLKYCGIDRPCKVWNEESRQNILRPLYELASSKLCRKTHEDMMVKVQLNMYTTGLHRVGSGAIAAYTHLELQDRFRMMCLAFGEPYYTVDKDLNVLTCDTDSSQTQDTDRI